MKFGLRKPSLKKSIRARTTGAAKRKITRALIPGYGKKGSGWIKNPKKAAYNAIYHRTTFSLFSLFSSKKRKKRKTTKGGKPGCIMSFIYLAIIFGVFSFIADNIVIIIAVFLVVLFIIGIIYFTTKDKGQDAPDQAETETNNISFDVSYEEVTKHINAVHTSASIVNTSSNVETVIKRIDILISEIQIVLNYDENLLRSYGYTKEYMPATLSKVLDNREELINQVIARAYVKELEKVKSLKTEKRKFKHMMTFLDKLQKITSLTDYNIKYVLSLKFIHELKIYARCQT